VVAFNLAVLLGNSAFHSPRRFLPLSSGLALVALVLYALAIADAEVGTDYVFRITGLVAQAAIVAFYFPMLLRLVRGALKHDCALRFPPTLLRREEAYLQYVRALLNRPPSASEVALRRGVREGSLNVTQRHALEEEMRRAMRARFGYKAQLLGYVRDFTVGDQAIHLPIRLTSAFLCSTFVQALVSYTLLRRAADLRFWSHHYASHLLSMQSASSSALAAYHRATAASLPDDSPDVRTALDLLAFWQPRLHSLGDALFAAAAVGVAAALAAHAAAWALLLADFRASVLQLRRGVFPFAPRVAFRKSFRLLGVAVSSNLLNFLLWFAVIASLTFLLAWQLTFDALRAAIAALWQPILAWLAAYAADYALTFAVTSVIGRKQTIHYRRLWMAYDLLQFFASCATGVATALTRLAIGVGLLLLAFSRMDQSLSPAWVDQLLLLDSLASSYRATVLLYHHHNNPVLHAFLQLVRHDAAARRAAGGEADATRAKWRVANRWRKTAFMLRNPAVASLKAGITAKGTPQEAHTSYTSNVHPMEGKSSQV